MPIEYNIEKKKGSFTLNSSSIFNNGITGIYGPSGSGKTTLFNIISGIEKPDKGYIKINNKIITDTNIGYFSPVNKRNIGVVFQDDLLFPHLSIKKNLLFKYKKETLLYKRVVKCFKLEHLLDSKPYILSGGEKQRTAIGRALLSNPDAILFDESFNAIDYELRGEIFDFIKKLNIEMNIPFIVISHDIDDLLVLTKSIYMMKKNTIMYPDSLSRTIL